MGKKKKNAAVDQAAVELAEAAAVEAAVVETAEAETVEAAGPLPVGEMTAEEIAAELEAIGDPYAPRRALGAERGELIVAKQKAIADADKAIGDCESRIHNARQAEDAVVNRQAELQRAVKRMEFEADALAKSQESDKAADAQAKRAHRMMREG